MQNGFHALSRYGEIYYLEKLEVGNAYQFSITHNISEVKYTIIVFHSSQIFALKTTENPIFLFRFNF